MSTYADESMLPMEARAPNPSPEPEEALCEFGSDMSLLFCVCVCSGKILREWYLNALCILYEHFVRKTATEFSRCFLPFATLPGLPR
jgi:hypothetical protein